MAIAPTRHAACHAAMHRAASLLAFPCRVATSLAAALAGTLVSTVHAQDLRPLPALADATRIHDTKSDAARTWPELLDALAKVDVVFLGETHVDDTTHRVE